MDRRAIGRRRDDDYEYDAANKSDADVVDQQRRQRRFPLRSTTQEVGIYVEDSIYIQA